MTSITTACDSHTKCVYNIAEGKSWSFLFSAVASYSSSQYTQETRKIRSRLVCYFYSPPLSLNQQSKISRIYCVIFRLPFLLRLISSRYKQRRKPWQYEEMWWKHLFLSSTIHPCVHHLIDFWCLWCCVN